ncbi:MAG: redox-sensing transcriptional repressor Rex [Spirochaetes bacterium]|nr:redox-sensing transcriptional repressor Rex [Spirochaetota bacterium]
MKIEIPKPSLSRICMVYNLLGELENEGVTLISSNEIGARLGLGAHSIRKDFSFLTEIGNSGAKYDVSNLRAHIGRELKINRKRKACIAGLGRLGSAILNYDMFSHSGYEIVAGFDSNINIIETLKTNIRLFPAYQIPDIVKNEGIELAVIAVPADAAQLTAERLITGGIRGIVNFSPSVIKINSDSVFISNIDVVKEFQVLSAFMGLNEED